MVSGRAGQVLIGGPRIALRLLVGEDAVQDDVGQCVGDRPRVVDIADRHREDRGTREDVHVDTCTNFALFAACDQSALQFRSHSCELAYDQHFT